MDLYSAVKRLERPFQFEIGDERESPLDARGMIGDGVTAALVRVDGAIDWLCMPRFDSPTVFAGLVDRERGGSSAVTPVARPFTSLQAYDPGTNVLETVFVVPGQGAVRLVDFMPWSNDPRASIHEIHRRIEGLDGRVEMELTFDPRFDYARDPADLDVQTHGVLARGRAGERFVAVAAPAPWTRRPAGGVAQRLWVGAGERRWMVLSWDAIAPEPIARYRSFEHLRVTRRAWRTWSNRLNYDGPWRHHVLRSALCLKLLTYAPTGAMVAAPTTSLPEWIGGHRNWDYRYAWVRDASFAIRAENLLGYVDEAREFFHFVRDAVDVKRGLEIMYAVDGGPVPEEEVLAHLAGYRGSQPVRIGNGARSQVQLDTTGALVDAAHLYERFGNALTLRSWRKIRALVEAARGAIHAPDHGIWEPRSGPRHNVHSKVMLWVALDRGAGIATAFGDHEIAAAWTVDAVRLRSEVLEHGLDPSKQHFVAAYGDTRRRCTAHPAAVRPRRRRRPATCRDRHADPRRARRRSASVSVSPRQRRRRRRSRGRVLAVWVLARRSAGVDGPHRRGARSLRRPRASVEPRGPARGGDGSAPAHAARKLPTVVQSPRTHQRGVAHRPRAAVARRGLARGTPLDLDRPAANEPRLAATLTDALFRREAEHLHHVDPALQRDLRRRAPADRVAALRVAAESVSADRAHAKCAGLRDGDAVAAHDAALEQIRGVRTVRRAHARDGIALEVEREGGREQRDGDGELCEQDAGDVEELEAARAALRGAQDREYDGEHDRHQERDQECRLLEVGGAGHEALVVPRAGDELDVRHREHARRDGRDRWRQDETLHDDGEISRNQRSSDVCDELAHTRVRDRGW